MRVKIKIKQVGEAVKNAAKIVLPVFGYAILGYVNTKVRPSNKFDFECDFSNNTFENEEIQSEYGRAVNSIANSTMSSYYKRQCIDSLIKNADNSYYEAVIATANSCGMSSYDRACAILNMGSK